MAETIDERDDGGDSVPTRPHYGGESESGPDFELCVQCGCLLDSRDRDRRFCPRCGEETARFDNSHMLDAGLMPAVPERFVLKEQIGKGAFGVVYKAWDRLLGRSVALKMPLRRLVGDQLLAREARAAAKLRHANIVSIFDVVESRGCVFIVSDFIDGQSLARYRRHHVIDTTTACKLCITIARAMDFAHKKGVIHRDLKPSNIVIDQQGQPFVLDFGLSISRSQPENTFDPVGCPVGTPAYMSPEQAVGDNDAIAATTDVYSLGVILYQLLSGELPFSGNNDEILQAILRDPPRSVRSFRRSIPRSLEAVIEKAMEKEPSKRYTSAAAFAEDLERFIACQTLDAYPRLDTRVMGRIAKRGILPLSVAFLLLTLVFVTRSLIRQRAANRNDVAVIVNSEPAGATLTFYRYDPFWGRVNGSPQSHASGKACALQPGFYKVVARTKNRAHEVFRTVPSNVDVPLFGPGIIYAHRNWKFERQRCRLPAIHLNSAEPNEDRIFIDKGHLVLGRDDHISPMFRGLDVQIQAFWISSREFGIGDVWQMFPDLQADHINFEIAAQFAENVGASLPSAEEYLYIDQLKLHVPGLRDGLKEWTASPLPAIEMHFGGKSNTLPGDINKRLILNTFDTGLREGKEQQFVSESLTHVRSFFPVDSHSFEKDTGFRLVWRQ